MTIRWLEFNKATGRVMQSVEGSETFLIPTPESDTVGRIDGIAGIDGSQRYIDTSTREVRDRPVTSITAQQTAGGIVTLSGVKAGTVVYVSGDASMTVTQDATDGQIQFTFPAGTFVLRAEQFPEQAYEATFSV